MTQSHCCWDTPRGMKVSVRDICTPMFIGAFSQQQTNHGHSLGVWQVNGCTRTVEHCSLTKNKILSFARNQMQKGNPCIKQPKPGHSPSHRM